MIATIALWSALTVAGLAFLTVLGIFVGRHLKRTNEHMNRIFREELDDPDRTDHRDDREDAS